MAAAGGSSGMAKKRLLAERKAWRKDHPHGFVAKPDQGPDATTNLFLWRCSFPGKGGTDWAGGIYPVTITFSSEYPARPPGVFMPREFFHPNVYHDGEVCLSIINEDEDWKVAS
jgi:ubiquitin-conjugating enzyme E2 I